MSELVSYGEPAAPDFDHVFRGRLVHSERSDLQSIEVYEHAHFGRMLLLDGVVQTTERDEYCYHEMLVHPALASRRHLDRVLIVGGGDGGTLRRALAHGPDEVVLCEIDEAVVRVSREHMPALSSGAFDDDRADVVYEDGAAYVDRHEGLFDAIIVDSTDPVGPGTVLFTTDFYAACRKALRPTNGILVAQSGSPFYQEAEFQGAVTNMAAAFGNVDVHTGVVPTYPGQLWTFSSASVGDAASAVPPDTIRERLADRGIRPRYYTPELHSAAFVLPAFLRDHVDEARAAAGSASVPGE